MSNTRHVDDLTPKEIKDIDDFYANDEGKKTMSFDEFPREFREES